MTKTLAELYQDAINPTSPSPIKRNQSNTPPTLIEAWGANVDQPKPERTPAQEARWRQLGQTAIKAATAKSQTERGAAARRRMGLRPRPTQADRVTGGGSDAREQARIDARKHRMDRILGRR
jgi:hypothetical protein